MYPSAPSRPYRSALSAAVGSALLAGFAVALFDTVLTARGAPPEAGFAPILLLQLGIYAVPALVLGVGTGLVGGAVAATFGPGAPRRILERLRLDRPLDRNVVAGMLAGAVLGLVFAGAIAFLSLKLVAGVERKSVGALLLGAVALAAIPALVAAWLPLFRLVRPIARAVPAIGPFPASLVLLFAAGAVGVLGVYLVVTRRLDWRALNLGGYMMGAVFAALFAAIVFIGYGPLAGARQALPGRGILVLVGATLALALVPVTLRSGATPATAALDKGSKGARILVGVGRQLLDRDSDGYSPFLGGPDCDDRDPRVNPDADEIAGNGIDDNCLGGDRASDAAGARPSGAQAATPTGARSVPAPPNVVVIAIDTLRADRLGAAGYKRDGKSLTPNLDRLASEGAYFRRVYAQAPNTPRSFPSLFASRYPSQLKVEKEFQNYADVLDENTLLFEVLNGAGFVTEGMASHFYFERVPGIRQGFDKFDNEGALDIAGSNKDTAAPRIVPRVEARLAELARGKQRFALFVHLFEPHSTYMTHDEFPLPGKPSLRDKYEGEIWYVDQYVGRVLEAIDKNGLADSTLVVALSDHGEAFGAHRVAGQKMYFHGQTLYDELVRVPLILRMPGMKPSAVDDPVMLVDVGPTVIDMLGLGVPDGMVGRSLLPRALGRPLEPRPAFAQLLPSPSWNHKWMAMVTADGAHKLIYRMSDRAFELYDLEKDPDETRDLYASEPELAERLREELTRWIEVDLPL